MSTARDYARFCQMMLNEGVLDKASLLKPATVHMMIVNQLPEQVSDGDAGRGPDPQRPRLRTGLCRADDARLEIFAPHDEPYTPVVEYFWGGAASTGFSISPKNDTVVVALTQFMPYKPTLSQAFIPAVDQAAAPDIDENRELLRVLR